MLEDNVLCRMAKPCANAQDDSETLVALPAGLGQKKLKDGLAELEVVDAGSMCKELVAGDIVFASLGRGQEFKLEETSHWIFKSKDILGKKLS